MERERILDRISIPLRRTSIRVSAGDTASTCGNPCGVLRAARRAMEMERIWRQYPEDDAGWMSM